MPADRYIANGAERLETALRAWTPTVLNTQTSRWAPGSSHIQPHSHARSNAFRAARSERSRQRRRALAWLRTDKFKAELREQVVNSDNVFCGDFKGSDQPLADRRSPSRYHQNKPASLKKSSSRSNAMGRRSDMAISHLTSVAPARR